VKKLLTVFVFFFASLGAEHLSAIQPVSRDRFPNLFQIPGRYGLASCDYLRGNDLDYIPPRELRLIRNEIFARHGHRFRDPYLQAHFAQQYWYRPLFDDVTHLLTPLEIANIRFIQEKERTNPEISDEEQFQIFLETYFADRWWPRTPRMLQYKFFVGNNDNSCILGARLSYHAKLPTTNNYVYLIHNSFWAGTSLCRFHLNLFQFNKRGDLLKVFPLGQSNGDPHIETMSNNRYEIWLFERFVGEDEETGIFYHVSTDTIRIPFHFDTNGQIIFTSN